MRGSEQLKNILKSNNAIKSSLCKSIALYSLCSLAIYLYRGIPITRLCLFSIPEIVALALLYRMSQPVFVDENGSAKLVAVTSLSGSGVISFLFDVLFWSMLGKILVAFSWKWAVLYLGILVSFLSEFIYKPYKKLKAL